MNFLIRPFEFENVTKGEKTREILKGCLHSTKLVQISIQFDEFFENKILVLILRNLMEYPMSTKIIFFDVCQV